MLLWILIAALTFLAIIYVCSPLLRSNVTASDDGRAEKLLYEARLKELDNEYALGRIDETSLTAAKTEEARKLLKLNTVNATSKTDLFSGKFSLIATAIFIPLFSVAIYMSVGTPEVAFQKQVVEETDQASIEELLAAAERRLEEVPDDLRGWLVVAPVYARQGNFDKSISAYKNAIRLSDPDPELTFALAEVLVKKSQGIVTEEALSYAQKTVELNKGHPSANFMLGLAAYQHGNSNEAVRIWEALLNSAQGNEEWVGIVRQRIDSIKPKTAGQRAPQLSQEAIESMEQLSDDERAEMINQMVAGLAEKLNDNPDDKQSWARLIRSYIVLGKYKDAEAAINKASGLFSDDPDFTNFTLEARSQIQNSNTEGAE